MNAGSYQEVIHSNSCLIYGKLNQKHKTGSWNPRKCAVWNKLFLCFKDDSDKKPQVAFVLDGFQVDEYKDIEERNVFQLYKPGVVQHLFAAESEDDCHFWITKLKEAGVISMTEGRISQEDMDKEGQTEPYFSSVDVDSKDVSSLSMTKPVLNVSLSFDSLSQVRDTQLGSSLQRSDEVEDLLSRVEETHLGSSLRRTDELEDLAHITSSSSFEEDLEFSHPPRERGKSLLEEVFEALDLPEPEATQLKEPVSSGHNLSQDNTDDLLAAVSALNTFIKTNSPTDSKPKINETQTNPDNDITALNHQAETSQSNESVIENKQTHQDEKNEEHEDETDAKLPIQDLPRDKKPANSSSTSQWSSGFVKVNLNPTTSDWKIMWAVLQSGKLTLSDSPQTILKRREIAVKGLHIQPLGDTGRPLAFKLVRDNKTELIMEPKDVEDLGRWVSGLFRSSQQSTSTTDPHCPPPSTPIENNSSEESSLTEEDMNEVVSVKEMRAVFEANKSTPTSPTSPSSSSFASFSPISPTIRTHEYQTSPRPISSPNSDILSGSVSPEELDTNFDKVKAKLEAKYADVVCWLGRYIEQEEEKQVLSSMANPYLAKLRIRHKLEMVAHLEKSIINLEQTIESLREKRKLTIQRRDSKPNNHGRLIRCAEDAKRTSNETKRIDKEAEIIEKDIQQAQAQLQEMQESVDDLQQEIELVYSQFDWGQKNSGKQKPNHETNSKRSQPDMKIEPDWTKKAKEKAKAWENIKDDFQ